jgi:UDP-GlcNAc:undecaprenyl-phosphate GlcNAc-1-phosphate transferase
MSISPLKLLAAAAMLLLASVLSASFCALARRFAAALGFLDRPGGRKAHARPIPLGGGAAIWLASLLVISLCLLLLLHFPQLLPQELRIHASGARSRLGEIVGILSLGTVVMLMGLLDDRIGLDWKLRLGIQCAAATAYVAIWSRVTLFPPFTNPWLCKALTILWIVGLTNAFNFLDNMDALAASVGVIAAILFAAAQIAVDALFVPAVLLVLVGALLGFLVHNHPPARLFMGDAGSNFLGFFLGCLTIAGTFTRQGYSPYGVLAPLLVMAVPLYDTSTVIAIRLREGRSPFEADRRHLSHRLVDRGLTPTQAVATIDLITLASGLGALLLHQLTPLGAAVVVAQTLCLLGVVAMLELAPVRRELGNGQNATSGTPARPVTSSETRPAEPAG